MRSWLRRIVKTLAYTGAAVVILLAIAVGLFRLFLPRLPEYQDEIKAWAGDAVGLEVEFSGMDARWGLSGPEIEFYDAELSQLDGGTRIIAASEVRIGVGLMRLLLDRTLVVDRVVIRESAFDVQQLSDGSFRLQGTPVAELFAMRGDDMSGLDVVIVGEDIEVRFMQPGDDRPRFFLVPEIEVKIDDERIAANVEIQPPESLGKKLDIAALQKRDVIPSLRRWDIHLQADDIDLSGWSSLAPETLPSVSGVGDIDASLLFQDGKVGSLTATLELQDVALASKQTFSVSGRIEADLSVDGWLLAVNEWRMAFGERDWPESNIRVEASVDDDGHPVLLDVRASYLNFDDLHVFRPLLNDEQQQQWKTIAPSGTIRDLSATLSDIGTDRLDYNVTVELDRVGLADAQGWPGVRGFSGMLRANRSGGRLEINAMEFAINAPQYVAAPIRLQAAEGTVIWRSSPLGTTILSDSIRIDGEDLQSRSDVQLVLAADGSAPQIDLASDWSIGDIAAIKRYIPAKLMSPKLYDWFQMALVSGRIEHGTTVLNGPLDKFPFDNGEGRLLINAAIRDMTFRYHSLWPAAAQADLDVVLDNVRLYSLSNRSSSAGNNAIDANVEIADLREPILRIKSLSTGSLETIRQFSLQSPIANVFGGQLERVTVSGDASFALDLTVPLKNVSDFTFQARVRSNNGSLSIDGFPAPITDLIGEVSIEREAISANNLGGRFLGGAVMIDLARSVDDRFSIVARANGTASAVGLVEELKVPLGGRLTGETDYAADIYFPRSGSDVTAPLTIDVTSELGGLGVDLPAPFGKSAAEKLAFAGDIRLLPGGAIIESKGAVPGVVGWHLAFNRPEDFWDLDRGVLALGSSILEDADTRGLHIRGTTEYVRFEDWLSLGGRGSANINVADRVRSIDVEIDDLFLIGQHLEGHRVRVDRSALDWLVQFEGPDIRGSAFVPYDFGGERLLVLEMQHLRLPGGDLTVDDNAAAFDPRRLPAMSITADEFAFGDRYLGAVSATIDKVAGGLQATAIQSKDDSFEIIANGSWLADESDALGSRTSLTGSLTSSDVERTMARLNYEPGIAGDNMGMLFDLSWSGGPRAEFLNVLDGEVQVRVENGQLKQVEPGAGRMFGLMSIVALPRRLSLDFRDVFNKGFGFDKIAGTFRINDGVTYTCDLSLDGPAADIGIVGVADIAQRTYDQTAVVSANVGNTLPIVGAVVAGPQVAAALLVFSQIFKKPLQEVGQVYYTIRGSWDDVNVEAANSAEFVASGDVAGCLDR